MDVTDKPKGDYALMVDEQQPGKSPWLTSFVFMAVFFSINHGAAVSVVGLSSADFEPDLAATANMTLYIFYTLSALFLAVPMVSILGPKKVITFGCGMYCCYVLPFAIIVAREDLSKSAKYALAVVGSLIGGIGAGGLWTAEGAYFAKASELYSNATGKPRAETNSLFGGIFAAIFLTCEVLLKIFSSIVRNNWKANDGRTSKLFVFFFYFGATLVGMFGILFVKPLPKENPENSESVQNVEKPSCCALATKKLANMGTVLRDPKIWMLAPLNLAFNFCASYVAVYFNGTVGKDAIGQNNIGYLTAVIPGYAALASVPYSYIQKAIGKAPMMFLGCLSFFILGLIGYTVDPEVLTRGGWGTMIGLYIVMGNGRAVFESTNKAVYADFFPDTQAGAFAVWGFQSGAAGAIGFLMFSAVTHVPIDTISLTLVVVAAVSLVTVPMAFVVNHFEKKKKAAQGRVSFA